MFLLSCPCKVVCFSLAPEGRPVCSIECELRYLALYERPVYLFVNHSSPHVAPTELLGCFNSISTNRPPLWGYIRSSPLKPLKPLKPIKPIISFIGLAFHTQINYHHHNHYRHRLPDAFVLSKSWFRLQT